MMSDSFDYSKYSLTQTQNWFSGHIPLWRSFFTQVTSSAPRALEIGSWEGRSAVFTLIELCGEKGSLVCIDHFDSFKTKSGRERYEKLTKNLLLTGRTHRIIPQFSAPALFTLLTEASQEPDPGFDWLYIDGSHEAADTFLDGKLAWRLARKGSIMVFDDYRWDQQPFDSPHHPKRGVDAFMTLHRGEFEVLSGQDQYEYQMALRKTVELSIGFAVDGATEGQVQEVLGRTSPVNFALATDSKYAMPTAVAISSAAKHTPGRLTFYVLDCGLNPTDRTRIQQSLPRNKADVTLIFLELPSSALALELGLVWAKVDLLDTLPVERAMYLDSDILVRKNLRPLWETALGIDLIAAAPDVGHPFGHSSDETDRFLHFNAGVLLLDMAAIRAASFEFSQTARDMKDSIHKDQDLLNKYFHNQWQTLSLTWNATGLGTYATMLNPDRSVLRLSEMADPAIVHFTGPVHPGMAAVINPWVQPYAAKPWGYAGAPGHPHATEWWEALKETGWRDWVESSEYEDEMKKEVENAKAEGCLQFEKAVGVARASHVS